MNTRASGKPLAKVTSNPGKLKKRTKHQAPKPTSRETITIASSSSNYEPNRILSNAYYDSVSEEWGYHSEKEEPISDKTPTPPDSPTQINNMAGARPDPFNTKIEDSPRIIPTSRQSAIRIPEIDTFTVKGNHLQIVKDLSFDGRSRRDPHEHLEKFELICNLFNYGEGQGDNVKMKLFPLSLIGDANKWLKGLKPDSLTTWGMVKEALVERFSHSQGKGSLDFLSILLGKTKTKQLVELG